MANLEIPQTMKSWRFKGTANGLEKNMYIDEATPLPPHATKLNADEVLVKVLCAALNPVDYKVAELPGIGRMAVGPRPATPGMDFAGRIVAVGGTAAAAATATAGSTKEERNERLKVGQLCFGNLAKPMQYGSLGQYIVSLKTGTVEIPDGVDVAQAAGIGVAGSTAYQSIVPFLPKEGDKTVFINGGSGGTGTFGIQIAKQVGCYVVTTCSTGNVGLCKELGADEVIDYKTADVVAALKKHGRQFDLVVDNVGGSTALYSEMHHYTTAQARYVQVGAEVSGAGIMGMAKNALWPGLLGGGKRKFGFLQVVAKPDEYAQIAAWIKEGKVKTVVDELFAYEDAPRAFEKLRTHRAKGKLVVRVDE